MSDLLSSAPTRTKIRLGAKRNDDTLTTIVVAAFIIAALYLGRPDFRSHRHRGAAQLRAGPPCCCLRRWRVARSVSVLIVVFIAFSFIFGLGTIITRQVSDLANELPRYQVTISQKMETVRDAATGSSFISHVADAFRSVGNPFARRKGDTPENAPAQTGGARAGARARARAGRSASTRARPDGNAPDGRLDRARAARDRRHRGDLHHLHSHAARGFARPHDPAVWRSAICIAPQSRSTMRRGDSAASSSCRPR